MSELLQIGLEIFYFGLKRVIFAFCTGCLLLMHLQGLTRFHLNTTLQDM